MPAGDPSWGSVSLLLHLEGANNSTTFTDEKGHSVTGASGTVISTAQHAVTGSSSSLLLTGDDYVSVTPDASLVLDGDFCAELFLYLTADTPSYHTFFGNRTAPVSLVMGMAGTNIFVFDGASFLITGTISLSQNTWYHIAVTRASGTLRLFVNGVADGSTTYSATIGDTSAPWRIGGDPDFSQFVSGYIDEVRITKGVARYTSGFTAPTAAFLGASTYSFSGTVQSGASAPLQRTVRAYKRSDGSLAGAVVSNVTTGAYVLTVAEQVPHYVLAIDSGTENAVILDQITPYA